MGKTTTAAKFPKSLLLATEKGYSAIPGIRPQPINSWSEFRQVLNQLKTDEAKAAYETILVDTVDIAYDYCTKYVCSSAGVDRIADIPYGAGYTKLKTEFDECLRRIVQMGYGLVLISHSTDKTFKDENGVEYNKIVPTLDKAAGLIVSRMADIIGYSRAVTLEDGSEVTKLFMRGTQRYMAGSRFKHTPDHIDFSYQSLTSAIADAIDKQAQEDGTELFTDDAFNAYKENQLDLDFDELNTEFHSIVQPLLKADQEYWVPRITEIVEKYLGRGKKISECDRRQVEAIYLIVTDLKDLAQKAPAASSSTDTIKIIKT